MHSSIKFKNKIFLLLSQSHLFIMRRQNSRIWATNFTALCYELLQIKWTPQSEFFRALFFSHYAEWSMIFFCLTSRYN